LNAARYKITLHLTGSASLPPAGLLRGARPSVVSLCRRPRD
jgi:hypothetical protein